MISANLCYYIHIEKSIIGQGKMDNNHHSHPQNSSTLLNIEDIIEFLTTCAIVAVLWIITVAHGFVSSSSMAPTLTTGDYVLYQKIIRSFGRGDIVNMNANGEKNVCKRIIGLPGEEISFMNGYVLINGEILDESDYISPDMETNCTEVFHVPEGCFFMLGDNREDSYDSRHWENPYISQKDIKGKMLFTIPFSRLLSQTTTTPQPTKPVYMSSIGEFGMYVTNNSYGLTQHLCLIEEAFAEKEAEDIIKEFFNRPSAHYEYPELPEGCSWHLILYSTTADPAEYYTDIRVYGTDGRKLTIQNETCSSRTYDIFDDMKEQNGFFTNLYCFYAIPNGCTEYMLRIGDQNPDEPSEPYAAFCEISH